MTLYHLTWESNLPSIRKNGIVPNFNPNGWGPKSKRFSVGRTFLCERHRIKYWRHSLQYRMRDDPGGHGRIVRLHVLVDGLDIRQDTRQYKRKIDGEWKTTEIFWGDFWTPEIIPPSRIKFQI